jgi:hypothetical protein
MNYTTKFLLNSLYNRLGIGLFWEISDLTDNDRVDILDTIDLKKQYLS